MRVDGRKVATSAGELLWYEGPGVYEDGHFIAPLRVKELIDLLVQHGYAVIRAEKEEKDQ
jgi:hypothetical protein